MLQDQADDFSESCPTLGFGAQLRFAGLGKPVKLGFAASFGRTPLGGEEFLVFKPMESGVKRTLLDLQRFFRNRLNALSDGVTMDRARKLQHGESVGRGCPGVDRIYFELSYLSLLHIPCHM